jgi:hypothetical protein
MSMSVTLISVSERLIRSEILLTKGRFKRRRSLWQKIQLRHQP